MSRKSRDGNSRVAGHVLCGAPCFQKRDPRDSMTCAVGIARQLMGPDLAWVCRLQPREGVREARWGQAPPCVGAREEPGMKCGPGGTQAPGQEEDGPCWTCSQQPPCPPQLFCRDRPRAHCAHERTVLFPDTGPWGVRLIQGHPALALPWPASDSVLLPPTLVCCQQERAVPGLGNSLSGRLAPRPPTLPQRSHPPPPSRACQACGSTGSSSPAAALTALLGAHQGGDFTRRVLWDLLPGSGLGRWPAPGVRVKCRTLRRRHLPVGAGCTVPLGRRGWLRATCLPRSSWQAVWGHGKPAPCHSPVRPENDSRGQEGLGGGGPTGGVGQQECLAWRGPMCLQPSSLPEDRLGPLQG